MAVNNETNAETDPEIDPEVAEALGDLSPEQIRELGALADTLGEDDTKDALDAVNQSSSRRGFLKGAGTIGLAGLVGAGSGSAAAGGTGQQSLSAGSATLAEATQVADREWIGPAATMSDVKPEEGRVFKVIDDGPNNDLFKEYYGDGNSWQGNGWKMPSLDTDELSVTVPSVQLDSDIPRDSISTADYATGGETIAAALSAMSTRGGELTLPRTGPDTVTNAEGVSESGVWEISQALTTGENSTRIVGKGPGWAAHESGTALVCSDSTVGRMLTFDSGFLDQLQDFRLDGAGNADYCLRLGADTNNDYQMQGVMAHDATAAQVELRGDKNFWITNCWLERNGAAISVKFSGGRLWIDNLLTFDCSNVISNGTTSNTKRWFIKNIGAGNTRNHAFYLGGGGITEGWFDTIHLMKPGQAAANTYDGFFINEPLTRVSFNNIIIDGGAGTTRHGFNLGASGSLTDVSFNNIKASGLAGSIFNGITGSANGTRVTIDGVGWNNGDPNTGGDWNGNGREGVVVYDDSTTRPWTAYRYTSGAWQTA